MKAVLLKDMSNMFNIDVIDVDMLVLLFHFKGINCY